MWRLLKYVWAHPLTVGYRLQAMKRTIGWQIYARIAAQPKTVPFTSRTKLRLERGMTGATGNFYCGLHEFEEMAFLLHFLRREDTFFDIGANVGSYTVLAAGHVGARTLSFEPIPQTYQMLLKNLQTNQIEHLVTPFNCGLAATPGEMAFTSGLDTMNHVACPDDDFARRIDVPLVPLDEIANGISPSCIKIDVEGYEHPVLKGGSKTLESESLKVIILELNGSGARYGFDEEEIKARLSDLDFVPISYEPMNRAIEAGCDHRPNAIYVRDLEFVNQRLQNADAISLPWREIPFKKQEVRRAA